MKQLMLLSRVFLLYVVFLLFGCTTGGIYNDIIKVEEVTINEPVLSANNKTNTYYYDMTIDLVCENSESQIYYTFDDSTPDRVNGALYTSPFPIKKTTVLSFCAYIGDTRITKVKKETYNYRIMDVVAKPESYENITADELPISLSSNTEGITIIYTTDGSTPTRDNGRVYEGVITISQFTILKFFAYKEGFEDTLVGRYGYSFKVSDPEISLYSVDEDIEIVNDCLIEISCGTRGTDIYYTLDGNLPSSNSFLYNGSLILTPDFVKDSLTLKVTAYKYGFAYSKLVEEKFIFKINDINISLPSGGYDSQQSVTLTSSLPGVSIYYTTNGKDPDSNSTLYNGPIIINSDTVLKVIGVKKGFKNSAVCMAEYKFKTSHPSYSIPSGTFNSEQNITINCSTVGSTIRFTTDGSDPSEIVGTIFDGVSVKAITVKDGMTVKSIAYKSGLPVSDIATLAINVNTSIPKVSNPKFSKTGGNYDTTQDITITTETNDARIYYTTDGSTPDVSDPAANFFTTTGKIILYNSQILRCIAYLEGYSCSDVVSEEYKIANYKLDKPVLSLSSRTYKSPENIEIMHSDPFAVLRYTLDGSEPTETSYLYYGSPLVITGLSETVNLKVKAFKTNCTPSDVVDASFTFQLPDVSFNPIEGVYNSSISLYLSQPVTGSTIRFTTDGSDPSKTNGTVFDGDTVKSIAVTNGMTVKAIAYKSGWKSSDVVSQTYTLKVNNPVFITDSSKTYSTPIKVQIDIVPKSAKIKYTLDGSDPKTSSSTKEYSEPFEIKKETKIRCYGYRDGWNESDVVETTYRFN